MMLLTNMSFTVATHFCGGKAVKSSVMMGKKDIGCGMEMPVVDDCEDSPQLTKKRCCESHFDELQTAGDYHKSVQVLDLDIEIVTAFLGVFFKLWIGETTASQSVRINSPPLILKNLLVLHQVFRL